MPHASASSTEVMTGPSAQMSAHKTQVDLDHHANSPRGLQIQYFGLAPSVMDGRSQQMPLYVPSRPWQNKAGTTQLSLPQSCFSAGEPESGTEFRDTHGSGFGHWSAVGRLGYVGMLADMVPHECYRVD